MRVDVEVPEDGEYLLEFEYSNGNGDITTNNKCANRSLFVDKKAAGVVVMPQRGPEDWTSKGYTLPIRVSLTAGRHTVELKYFDENINMNIDTDSALVRSLRVYKTN